MALDPLAVTADLTARGIDTTVSPLVALAVASTVIREAAENSISQLTSTVTVPAPCGNLLTLPGPVTAVDSVSIDGGTAWTVDVDYYVLPEGVYAPGGWDAAVYQATSYGGGIGQPRPLPVTITFTHGLAVVPVDIVDLTCSLAGMWIAAQKQGFPAEAGVESAKVDDYAETRTPESAGQVSPVWIPEVTRAKLAARFGGGAYVVELG